MTKYIVSPRTVGGFQLATLAQRVARSNRVVYQVASDARSKFHWECRIINPFVEPEPFLLGDTVLETPVAGAIVLCETWDDVQAELNWEMTP